MFIPPPPPSATAPAAVNARKTAKFSPPPPPKVSGGTLPAFPPEPASVPISPDLSRFDLETAVWIHGGYPQLEWPDAVRALLRKCRRYTRFDAISAAAIWELDRLLPDDCDLTSNRHIKDTY